MQISCPLCTTRFLVEPEEIGQKGRVVRCGSCDNVWLQVMPKDPVEDLGSNPKFEVAAEKTPPKTPPPAPKSKAWMGWLLLGAVLVAAVIGVLYGREQILARMAQDASQNQLGGGAVVGEGLVFSRVTSKNSIDAGKEWLVVSGELTNVSAVERDIPRLRGTVTSEAGEELSTWVFAAPVSRLAAGESTGFETRSEKPSRGANLSISFDAQ